MTPFVGRADELAALLGLVQRDDVRLVTISGTAGVGKTRLAVELGRRLSDTNPVAYVSLAEVHDPALIGSTLLAALGVADAGAGDAALRAAEVLGEDPGVLVLDNLEHLLPGAASIAALLEASPRLTVVTTSRHPLALRAERVVPLAPLALPHGDPLRSDAVAFLVERLEALDPSTSWSAQPDLLADIATQVDGLPLALELAAARARVLTLEAIRDGLDRRLDLLAAGGPDAPDRQRTMRDAVAWSCALLPPESAAVFRRLGACLGGAALPMVEAVSADLGLARAELLDALDDLVSHSLVTRDAAGRFRLLEVVREHAAEELARAGETDAAQDRLAQHALEVLEDSAPALAGAEQLDRLEALVVEAPNLTAAVRHALERSDTVLALRLCLGLRFLWYVRGPLVEGQALFAAALALPGGPDDLRARAFVEAAALSRHRGELTGALSLAERGLAVARDLDDEALVASALLQLGFVLHLLGRYDEAQPLLEESLAIREAADDRLGSARVLHHLALVAHHGRADLDAAWDLQVRALAQFREVANQRHVAIALIGMTDLARERNDLGDARTLLHEALELVVRLQDQPLLSYALFRAAELAAEEGRASAAVRLLGAAEAVARTCGAPPWPVVAASTDRWLPGITSRYGGPRVSALRAAGASMPEEEAIRLAAQPEETSEVLSGREREIADLVAEGLTNRAIAARLVISGRTVDGHVASILTKLGFSSRAQVAAWATEQRALLHG